MNTVVLSINTPLSFAAAVVRSVELLRAGEAVALPTETVYGLAANALDAGAVSRVFEIKGRPLNNPVIVHVASMEMGRQCVADWPPSADRLAVAFWPGPLTLVLPRSGRIPDIVTAAGPTVAVRWPSHPFIQEVIRACGFPLAAPSANLASELSPTNATHVLKSLGGKIPIIVDGGQSQVGIESTVLDLTTRPVRILRPGMISSQSLRAALINEGEASATVVSAKKPGVEDLLRSPGQLPRHYAPKARLAVWEWQTEADLKAQILKLKFPLVKVQVIAHTQIPGGQGFGRVRVLPHNPAAFGRALYAEMHRCDEEGAELIVVEALPEGAAWAALRDRLQRAASSAV